ncbi:hypothetical protein [Vibrio navarrensis]
MKDADGDVDSANVKVTVNAVTWCGRRGESK